MKNLNLKIIRVQTGLTQLQLAEKSGISLSRISRIEAGYAVPHLDELKAFSRVLGACVCRKLNAYQPISTKSKEQIISTRQNKSFPNSPFKLFAVLFTVLAVLAIVKGLDATAAVSTACLFLLIFAKFLPNWKINFKDYFSFHNSEK